MSTNNYNDNRLLELLRGFSPPELRDFGKYLASPYAQCRKEGLRLFAALLASLKNDAAAPEKAALFHLVFGTRNFDDHRLRMAFSLLHQAACRFITLQDFIADETAFNQRQAEVMRRRKLPAQAGRSLQKAESAMEQHILRNAGFHETAYRLALEKYESEMALPSPNAPDLQDLSDRLDTAYLARKLWQSCFMLSHQARGGPGINFGLLPETLDRIEQLPAFQQPAVSLYYLCYRAMTQPTVYDYYRRFKEDLFRTDVLFPPEELRDLYILAINFCIRQYNAGNSAYLQEQFDFYRAGFQRGYFLVEGNLSRYTYLNAATSALALHELDWVEKFIHQYRHAIALPDRESLFSFNLARLEYQRNKLDIALRLLQKVEYKDTLLALAAKMLQLKIYYRMDVYDLLESHLQALDSFVRRKKELGYHRENYRNTIRFTRRLLEIPPFEKETRSLLLQEIEQTSAVAEKEWLLEVLRAG